MDRLDETDERILAELAEHARATFAEIGQRVNLSAPAVKRRVDRMLDNGVIRGFTTVVDRNALGWTTEAYVQVFCHGTIAPAELRAAWMDIPEVVSAATVTGTRTRSCMCWPAICAISRRHWSASVPVPISSAVRASWCCRTSSSGGREAVTPRVADISADAIV